MRVSFRTLQRNSHRHLPHGAPGQAKGAAQGLGPEDHVDPKGTTLSDELLQGNGRILRELVVFGEEDLKLIHHEHGPGHSLFGGVTVCGDILHAGIAEQIAAVGHLGFQAKQNTQAEFTVTFNGHGPYMGQAVCGIGLEFHTLLEVNEVQFDFIRAVPQGQVGDHHVQECGLARSGLARNEHVL